MRLEQAFAPVAHKIKIRPQLWLIAVFTIVFCSLSSCGETKLKPEILRVGFNFTKGSYTDPGKIIFASQYIFFENVFSPLIELSKTGEIIAGVAKNFEWKGNEIFFEIRNDLKTIDGKPITALDAANSLKRLIMLTGNTHGDLKSLLCRNEELHYLSDQCSGIEVRDNTLILKPKKKETFLLPMLAAIDFSVIPTSSLDEKTLDVKDLRNTSGPYYVEEYRNDKPYRLRVNPTHYHYSKNIPQEITLISLSKSENESIRQFRDKNIDLITTIDDSTVSDLLNFTESNSEAAIHRTLPIKVYMAYFSARGLQEIDADSRHYLALKIKEIVRNVFKNKPGFESVDQFFPSFGSGGLQGEKAKALSDFLSVKGKLNSNLHSRTINIGIWSTPLTDSSKG